jgi:hypothetical protein
MVKRRYELYDAFPLKKTANRMAKDLRKSGDTATVRKGNYGDNNRLKWAVYTAGRKIRK